MPTEPKVFNIDADLEDADWVKQTFDLAHGTVPQMRKQMLDHGWTRERLDLYKKTNTGFKLAVMNRPELADL